MFASPKCHILSFKTPRSSILLCKFLIVINEQLDTYHFTDLAYADDAAILMSDRLQIDSVLRSFNAFTALTVLLHLAQSYHASRRNSKTWVQVTRRRQYQLK